MSDTEQLGEHEMRCLSCGQIIDMRDLGEVIEHENCRGWDEHDADCTECGASTQTNGEIIHCTECRHWWEIDSSTTDTDRAEVETE